MQSSWSQSSRARSRGLVKTGLTAAWSVNFVRGARRHPGPSPTLFAMAPFSDPASSSSSPIAVVTTTGCPHCKRVKDALSAGAFDFVAVNMSKRPASALVELKRQTRRGTVPQVFVGGVLVGGADETISLIEGGELRRMVDDVERRGGFEYEPPGVSAVLFGGADVESSGFVDELMRLRSRRVQTTEEERPVSVDPALLEYCVVFQVGEARAAGSATLPPSYMWSEDVEMVDKASFDKYGKARPLNGHLAAASGSGRAGVGTLPDQRSSSSLPSSLLDPVAVSARLRTVLLALYDTHLADDGAAVDYDGLRRDPRFRAYVDLAASLDDVDLGRLDSKEAKLAFWINTYNSLIVHALTVVGPAENTLQRLTWFGRVAYRIGGFVFSADDIEHGILRGNASPPASVLNLLGLKALAGRLSPAFPASDPRRLCSLEKHEVDPRIHFALNCGAKSCPAIKVYSPDVLEEGLQGAAEAFCEEEVRVRDLPRDGSREASMVIEMSSILKWYGGDFGATQHERLRYLMPYLGEADRDRLAGQTDRALDEIRVEFRPYDWALNSSK